MTPLPRLFYWGFKVSKIPGPSVGVEPAYFPFRVAVTKRRFLARGEFGCCCPVNTLYHGLAISAPFQEVCHARAALSPSVSALPLI
jgi:hypothetical protein